MPRRRTRTRRNTYDYPDDFGRALELIKEASGWTWAELARQLGTSTLNLWRCATACAPTGTTSSPCRTWPAAWASPTCCPRRASGVAPRP